MVKKKKDVITIKTSLKSVLLDNEAAQEFKETLEELVKKQHLIRTGTRPFLHWYLLNEMEPREINVEFIRAVLTVLNGAPISNTNSSFGNKLVYLKPLIDQFIRDSKAESLFAPTLASYDRQAQDFVIANPRPTDWKSRLVYEDVVKCIMNGKALYVYGDPDYDSLKEKGTATKSTKRKTRAAEPVNNKKQKTVKSTPAAKKQPSRAAQQKSNPIISQDSNVVIPKESIEKTTTPKPDSIKKQNRKRKRKSLIFMV